MRLSRRPRTYTKVATTRKDEEVLRRVDNGPEDGEIEQECPKPPGRSHAKAQDGQQRTFRGEYGHEIRVVSTLDRRQVVPICMGKRRELFKRAGRWVRGVVGFLSSTQGMSNVGGVHGNPSVGIEASCASLNDIL